MVDSGPEQDGIDFSHRPDPFNGEPSISTVRGSNVRAIGSAAMPNRVAGRRETRAPSIDDYEPGQAAPSEPPPAAG